MGNQNGMQNQVMMKDSMMNQMNSHQNTMYTFGALVLIGLAILIVVQVKILNVLRKKR